MRVMLSAARSRSSLPLFISSRGNHCKKRTILLLLTFLLLMFICLEGLRVVLDSNYVQFIAEELFKNTTYESESEDWTAKSIMINRLRRRAGLHDYVDLMEKITDNIPFRLVYLESKKVPLNCSFESVCSVVPPGSNMLKINNDLWQAVHHKLGFYLLLYCAHLDQRPNVKVARVYLATKHVGDRPEVIPLYCQFWSFEGPRAKWVAHSKAKNYLYLGELVDNKGDNPPEPNPFYTVTFECDLPTHTPLSFLSVTSEPCENATNALTLERKKRAKRGKLGICVKPLMFIVDDISQRLAEWLELLREQGLEFVCLYTYFVHKNIQKVLRRYQSMGFVEVVEFNTPEEKPKRLPRMLWPKVYSHKKIPEFNRLEQVARHDCFYRNLEYFDDIIFLDIDEVIVPTTDYTVSGLVDRLRTLHPDAASITFGSYIFPPLAVANKSVSVSNYSKTQALSYQGPRLYMMDDTMRMPAFSIPFKSILSTRWVTTFDSHFAQGCLGPDNQCTVATAPEEEGAVFHYRVECMHRFFDCETFLDDMVNDTTMWKYRKNLTKRLLKLKIGG